MLAAASISGEIAFFMPNSDRPEIHHGSAHEFGISSVSWHPRLPLLASGGQDGLVKTLVTGKAVQPGRNKGFLDRKSCMEPRWSLAGSCGGTPNPSLELVQ